MFASIRKKIAVDQIVYPWNIGLSCGNCAQQFTVMRRKKHCVFCDTWFCHVCIERRPDKRLSCHKCVVLTSRPIDREQLFNLKSRDLVAYLSSRHISTTDCIEKEDLVNAVLRSVNVPPSYSSHGRYSNSGSCPTSPNHLQPDLPSTSYSHDDVRQADGIRVTRMNSDSSSPTASIAEPFVIVDPADCGVADPSASAPEGTAQPTETPTIPPPAEASPQPTPEPRKRILLSDISDVHNLDSLTVRQLKELLAYNRIDFTGCVERSELIEKCTRLWISYNESRKAIEQLSHEDLCKICMDAPIECVLLECGHTCTCTLCGKQLSECPICRQYVIRCVRTFKA